MISLSQNLVISLAVGCGLLTPKAPAADGEPAPIKRSEELKFKVSSFTFVRVKYSLDPASPGHTANRWAIDYPESDRRFSAWFEKKTGFKTDTNGIVLGLTDPRLKDYPFIYM